ncbi:MAG: N-acetylmuramic acid 6-phosphate etherase [Chloroflexi bacterium]|nr:N-acetylmuramic acid 6-phosphate etherase [Chloroflexota bacterium]
MEPELASLTTEEQNPASLHLDRMNALEIVQLMNEEDRRVPEAIATQLPQIAAAIDAVVERMHRGGRLFYIGAGTSGRLGVLDAAECIPTFSTPPDKVQAIIAGGTRALTRPVEGAEDDYASGEAAVAQYSIGPDDSVVGLSASGRAPFVLAALAKARLKGSLTIGICCTAHSSLADYSDIIIAPIVGPEILTGSTRLKAGTAQKLILNMLSTGTMVRLGKCLGNLMVDLQPTNAKLRDRAARILQAVTGCTRDEAYQSLQEAGFEVKVAIVMRQRKVDCFTAEHLLEMADGHLHKVLHS